MKEVTYQNFGKSNEIFLLTNKEWEDAMISWRDKKDYYCERLGSVLSKRYSWIKTPKSELDSITFLIYDKELKSIEKVYKRGEHYFIEGQDHEKAPMTLRHKTLTEEQIKGLKNQEDYYNDFYEKKLLIK